jgi:hypothetical protein
MFSFNSLTYNDINSLDRSHYITKRKKLLSKLTSRKKYDSGAGVKFLTLSRVAFTFTDGDSRGKITAPRSSHVKAPLRSRLQIDSHSWLSCCRQPAITKHTPQEMKTNSFNRANICISLLPSSTSFSY